MAALKDLNSFFLQLPPSLLFNMKMIPYYSSVRENDNFPSGGRSGAD